MPHAHPADVRSPCDIGVHAREASPPCKKNRISRCSTAQPPAANIRRADAPQVEGGACAGEKDLERLRRQAEYPQQDNRRVLLACASTPIEYLCASALDTVSEKRPSTGR